MAAIACYHVDRSRFVVLRFSPPGGTLKIPNKLPSNADERDCCISPDGIFSTPVKPKTKNGFLSAIIVSLRARPNASCRAYLYEESRRAAVRGSIPRVDARHKAFG
ncbi:MULTISPECIES: hypothetical protein [Paraburkholderia]|uniref:hypothetical protein n=1 Tax=Paraburkholderia TaxID=1822464 RepID=UPI0012F6DEAF|nr:MULTISPECIES: hypothetical protein [Paraburkholderia]MDR8395856.1 hypothetical protein [Paraburkholderia sp. USG1]